MRLMASVFQIACVSPGRQQIRLRSFLAGEHFVIRCLHEQTFTCPSASSPILSVLSSSSTTSTMMESYPRIVIKTTEASRRSENEICDRGCCSSTSDCTNVCPKECSDSFAGRDRESARTDEC